MVKAVRVHNAPTVFAADLVQGDRKLVLHRQNALAVDPGEVLDATKKKRAVRAKKVVSLPRALLAT